MAKRTLNKDEMKLVRHYKQKRLEAQEQLMESTAILDTLAKAFEPTVINLDADCMTIEYRDEEEVDG